MTYPKGDTNPEKGRRYPTNTGYAVEETRKAPPPKTEVPQIRTRGYPSERSEKQVDAGEDDRTNPRTAAGVASAEPTPRPTGSVKHLN